MKFKNKIEQQDTKEIIETSLINWDFFKDKTVLVTGGTGLIGTQIIKALLFANSKLETNINVIALVRNSQKVKDIFGNTKKNKIKFIYQDIEKNLNYSNNIDYIIHTANSTSSSSFVETPVETIGSIVQGTKNILNFAKKTKAKSVVYLSSMEVYGEIPLTREEPLNENDLGYVDILKPRSSYQEGKRAAECLCAAYAHEYKVPVKIARLAQTFGAGVDYNDNRVFAQFARNIVEKQDIVLKTKGETIRSYCYITDAVVAILSMLERGEDGESYNVANPKTTCSIKEMAEMLCKKYTTSHLIIEPQENRQYLGTLKYYLSDKKLQNKTGWVANVNLEVAYRRIIDSFYYQKNKILNLNLNNQGIKKKRTSKYSFIENIFSVKNTFKYKVIRVLGINIKINRLLFYKKYYDLPIEENKIVFCNFKGSGYGCNPKYIAEEIIKRKLPYKLVWLAKTTINEESFPPEIKIVDWNSKLAIKELATAKVWIDNQRKIRHIKKGLIKKENQIYIQTWHGSLGIKRIGLSSPISQVSNSWVPFGEIDAQMIDILLSNSQFENDVFKDNFWGHGELKLFGHPRNDVFFMDSKSIKDKFCAKLGIDPTLNLLLYAPSYREDGRVDCFGIDADSILKTLEEKTGKEWAFIVRMHPNITKFSSILFDIDNKKIFDGSKYSDIQEILSSVDAMITDYSSCVFDFMLSRKPAFIYATDIEEFNSERGFYYPIESTPFPIATNNLELVQNIIKFDYEKYKNEVGTFLQEKGCMEDGQASKRVVDVIEQIIKTNFKEKA